MSRIVVLIPAHNEAASISDTISGLLQQSRPADLVVAIPNGCSDNTADIARGFSDITVLDLPKLSHGKSEAMNIAWRDYAQDADILICIDADTVLPPNALEEWERDFVNDRPVGKSGARSLPLGGSSSKFTMLGDDFLTRIQRAEFARWTDTALRRGWTTVLAGTGCAISGEALRQVAALPDREGPWTYASQVEDFELTYQIRRLGYRCQVSPTVRAYTDSMKNVRSLWGQRMKWQTGTVEDLMALGVNRLTVVDWWQQIAGLFAAAARLLWVFVIVGLVYYGQLHFIWYWWTLVPALFIAVDVKAALRIPHRDRRDLLHAFLLFPAEAFAWLRAGWFLAAWGEVLAGKVTGKRKDRWALQYAAEKTPEPFAAAA